MAVNVRSAQDENDSVSQKRVTAKALSVNWLVSVNWYFTLQPWTEVVSASEESRTHNKQPETPALSVAMCIISIHGSN